jgi:hypothetical protein
MNGAPLPQERPYDLGEGGGRMASAYPEIRQSIAANREPPTLYEPPARDARSLAAAALARQPARTRMVETAPDTAQTAYSAPRLRSGDSRNPPSGALASNTLSAPPSSSPATAYAPVYFDGGAVSTGRGLY